MKHNKNRLSGAVIEFPAFDNCISKQFDHSDFNSTPSRQIKDRENCISICDGLIDILSALFNVSSKELRSPKRSGKTIDRVRQIGMYIAHVSLGLNMAMVAEGFRRAKSTVVHACHVIEDLRDDIEFDQIVNRVDRIVAIAFPKRQRGM